MPEPNQNLLIRILVLWNTVITIFLIVLFVLYFTAGHKGLENSAVESSKISSTEKRWTTTAPSSLASITGKMLNFKFETDESDITWNQIQKDKSLLSKVNNGLSTNVDGYYFLNLQVTMDPSISGCSTANRSTVELVKIQDGTKKSLLMGLINKETNTTGILSKVVECGAGERLIFNISNLLLKCVDKNDSKTHLDIIFMPRL
ncbi:tumor necrosis factor ligand superfamily member 18 [Pundamilia nyererei]|uniref:Tumor necrosis factor ligand superfamily member 18 n=1 Tax=Pundamilia nyererei TaxID=303518 RepID=A0A9Y3RQI3_9CICH|nr:PREDICTED: uncharacterized protein LOC102205750 [Pundamilia nyererei]